MHCVITEISANLSTVMHKNICKWRHVINPHLYHCHVFKMQHNKKTSFNHIRGLTVTQVAWIFWLVFTTCFPVIVTCSISDYILPGKLKVCFLSDLNALDLMILYILCVINFTYLHCISLLTMMGGYSVGHCPRRSKPVWLQMWRHNMKYHHKRTHVSRLQTDLISLKSWGRLGQHSIMN